LPETDLTLSSKMTARLEGLRSAFRRLEGAGVADLYSFPGSETKIGTTVSP
jgi:hypothetical protein